MLIYFDRQGAIREVVSSYALSDGTASFKRAEGNSSVNRIYCYFEGLAAALPSATAGAISYRLPDGTTIGPRVSDALETLSIDFDASRDLRYFAYDKDYIFLRFDVPDEVFSLSGLISATASATVGEATYQFGPITFMVDGEVLAQADIDYSQWQYLISQFARYLPLSGGEITSGITSENEEMMQKVYFGNGRIAAQDTEDGYYTYFNAGSIERDGKKFYYPMFTEDGGKLITDRWSGFSGYLPISGGKITGEITTENEEIEQKVILGNGRIGVQDTTYGFITYFDANYIERVGDKFYYPEGTESGGRLITNKWRGFNDYAKKTDLKEYAKKADLGDYATKKDFDDLKSIVYGIHSLTYNSYEFSYLTSSAIPDEVDGRKVVGGSYAIADWVGGNSVAFNQLQLIPANNQSITIDGITITDNRDGSFILNGTATANIIRTFGVVFTSITNHKYLLKGCPNGGSASTYRLLESYTYRLADIGNGSINTITSDGVKSIAVDIKEGTTINNLVFRPQIFDLTLMGLDNITSVDEFTASFPNDYYPYNAGEIKSTVVTKIESWGYNLLNLDRTAGAFPAEAWKNTNPRDFEEDKYYAGLSDNNYYSTQIGTVDNISSNSITIAGTEGYGCGIPVKVIAGKTYTFSYEKSGTGTQGVCVMSWYDKDGNYLSQISASSSSTVTGQAPNNAYWCVLMFRPNGTITYSNICFHLTGSRTGDAPYVGKLGQINIPNAPLRLDGVNDIHDTLTFEEQSDGTYNAIHTINIGDYTFTGEEQWNVGTGGYGFALYNFVQNTGAKPNSSNNNKPVILSSVYSVDTPASITSQQSNEAISYNVSGSLLIRDTNITSATDMASKMAGKTIHFERATPTRETIATGLTFDKVSFPIERGGAIEAVYEEVPPTASIDFMTKGE